MIPIFVAWESNLVYVSQMDENRSQDRWQWKCSTARSRYAESSIYKCIATQMAMKRNERAAMDDDCATADDLASG